MEKWLAEIFARLTNLATYRTCVDWDSGISIREMKNNKGEWLEVGKE